MPPDLAALAAQQHGVFSLAQAKQQGLTAREMRALVAAGVIESRFDGDTYVVKGSPDTELRRLWLAICTVGEPCALVGHTAAAAHRLPGSEFRQRREVGIATSRNPPKRSGIWARRLGRFDAERIVHVAGLPVMDAAWTIGDLATRLSTPRLVRVVQDAVFRDLAGLVGIEAECGRGVAGSGRLREAVDLVGAGHDSMSEVIAFRGITGLGLRVHPNVWLFSPDGRVAGPADGYLEQGLAYEIDGLPHLRLERRVRDLRKDEGYASIGVAVRRFEALPILGGDRGYLMEVTSWLAEHADQTPPAIELVSARLGRPSARRRDLTA